MIEALTDWFLREGRALPFRAGHSADGDRPYYVLVSETMAQQTRMEALVPYYGRFIARFPDIRTLADAGEAEVLALWAGLGYYSRARNLHKAARAVCERHGGAVPDSLEALRALPGVGAYTAGAVASIAFGLPCPAVDGNVRRVYARLFMSDGGDVSAWARGLMDQAPPRLVTESLMELGALICTPSPPKCGRCPVSEHCRAFSEDRVADFPARRPKPPKREENRTVCIVRDGEDRVLLRRRTERLLHNMWEFPVEEQLLADGFAVRRDPAPLGTASHVFTHIIWRMTAYGARVTTDKQPENYLWAKGLRGLALPSAMRAWARLLFAGE
ncbi:MAG: A/G-specific adenine glycosylase [Oscillospiraceae bacterium]|nr:A/G-specific adenine glycosylase [Oscillospiraceae bacterium]